ncbi:MAG: Bax inhibitor-1/YccA family protein [Phycisphaerales bacterium]
MNLATSSPMMKPEVFQGGGAFGGRAEATPGVMTVNGAITKTAILLGICVVTAVGSWVLASTTAGAVMPLLWGGLIAGFVSFLIMSFKPESSPFVAPIYAVSEGAFVGAVSLLYATAMQGTKVGGATGGGIVATAALGTFAILGLMLGLYKVGLIRAGALFTRVMIVAGAGIALYAVATIVMAVTGMMPAALQTGPLAIAICVGILVYASFCLILDFAFIEEGAANGAPKYLEWYGGAALLMTLVWIYLKLLRLLSLLSKRN